MRKPSVVRRGFTLIELMASMLLLAIIGGAITSVLIRTQRSYVEQRESSRAHETARALEQLISRFVRTARTNPFGTANTAIDPNPLARATWDNVRLRGDFNPADGDLADQFEDVLIYRQGDTVFVRWEAAGAAEPIATSVSQLLFRYYAMNGTQITNPAAIGTAARVRVTISVRGDIRSPKVATREAWVNLRN
jgi:prepilin-type N-terminal cleavage/methylation domain-containing protein